jgi:Gp37 protein
MNYEQLEDAITARLTAKLPNDYRVIVMEDSEAEMARPVTMPQVAVCYLQSDYDRAQSNSHVSQSEQPTFMIMLTCRKRRGVLGIYALYDLVCKCLLGWIPPNKDFNSECFSFS